LQRLLSVGDERKDWARVSAWALLSSHAKSHPSPILALCARLVALTLAALALPSPSRRPGRPTRTSPCRRRWPRRASRARRSTSPPGLNYRARARNTDTLSCSRASSRRRSAVSRARCSYTRPPPASRRHFSRSATPACARRRRSISATPACSSSAACSRSRSAACSRPCSVMDSGTSVSRSSARRRRAPRPRARSACACVCAAPPLSWPRRAKLVGGLSAPDAELLRAALARELGAFNRDRVLPALDGLAGRRLARLGVGPGAPLEVRSASARRASSSAWRAHVAPRSASAAVSPCAFQARVRRSRPPYRRRSVQARARAGRDGARRGRGRGPLGRRGRGRRQRGRALIFRFTSLSCRTRRKLTIVSFNKPNTFHSLYWWEHSSSSDGRLDTEDWLLRTLKPSPSSRPGRD
jgi:hypothetical protein